MLDTPPQSQLTPHSSASSSIATPNNAGNLFGSPVLENELRQPSSDHLNRVSLLGHWYKDNSCDCRFSLNILEYYFYKSSHFLDTKILYIKSIR